MCKLTHLEMRKLSVDALVLLIKQAIMLPRKTIFWDDDAITTLVLDPLSHLTGVGFNDVQEKQLQCVQYLLHCYGERINGCWLRLINIICAISQSQSVIVVKPVQVLMACASEDFEGGGLDDVSQLIPWCLHGGVIIWSMQVLQLLGYLVAEIKTCESYLGDDEAVIGIADRLGHQHILLISPPDENIVQTLPAPRPRMPPRGLLARRKAEVGVGQQETVFRAGSQKKEVAIVTATDTVWTQHSLPGSVVCPDTGVEVTKANSRILLR
ncbi:unnamed protein product [Schistocephalus solidus]|uniref:DUF1981 domain-containing protein n=1 Tax=Schistocephalus solidus TaxID=70667 RepID=A0A183SFL6_SCHSO|nr:unnamed protein product [Schistocephalus solidus]